MSIAELNDSLRLKLRLRALSRWDNEGTSDRERALARQMAAYTSPRLGSTPHQLTIRASAEMNHLVDRADFFHDVPLV